MTTCALHLRTDWSGRPDRIMESDLIDFFLIVIFFFCYFITVMRRQSKTTETKYQGSFRFSGSKIWNTFPPELRGEHDLTKIKKRGFDKHLKLQANGRNIVGQQHATLLGPKCCVCLHGTTTMLALVAYSLKRVKLLGPCKRTQH